MNADFWVKASPWATKRFRCDYLASCGRPVRRIHVQEGEPQHGYCYPHYLEAKANAATQCMSAGPKGEP
jgi:hypothetical protein